MKKFILISLVFFSSLQAFTQTPKASEASNQLAFDLYKLNAKNPGNVFFSPFSIELALAMTSAGAKDETLKQMLKTLHLTGDYHGEFQKLQQLLKGNKKFDLFVANRLWGQSGTAYIPEFLKVLATQYGAELTPTDFRNQPEPARFTINKWVEAQTKDKIKDLLPPGTITSLTDLVLTNAIYFKGSWFSPFKKEQTKDEPFFISKDQRKSVPMMHQTDSFLYAETKEYQYVQLPYAGDELVMDIILPTPAMGLAMTESKLGLKEYAQIYQGAYSEELQLSLPKFKTEQSLDLNDQLVKLGMPDAFHPRKANFRGMRNLKPDENLYISKVIHKAFVDVNEKGTEAAAATAVVMAMTESIPKPPIVFKADRPFLFFIRHVKSGTVLFMGRYSQP